MSQDNPLILQCKYEEDDLLTVYPEKANSTVIEIEIFDSETDTSLSVYLERSKINQLIDYLNQQINENP